MLSFVSASEVTDNSDLELNENIHTNQIEKNTQENLKTETENKKTIELNSNNFDEYVTNKTFNDKVSEGDTVDFQGKFDSKRFDLRIDKPLNIISTTNDSYINIHSIKLNDYEESGGLFKLDSGSSGTNITGLNFENTRISIRNVSNINIKNCSVIADTIVGRGVGMFSVGGDSNNITITNCYFEKIGGQHSIVVFSGATNVLFENNTIVGTGSVGNLLYLTTYNSNSNYDKYSNQNFTLRNNYINGNNAAAQDICYAAALEGQNLLIENNIIEYRGKCLVPQWGGGSQNNITIINNTIPFGTCYLSFPNQTIEGNILNNVQSNNNALYNNTIKNLTTLGNLTLEENILEKLTINGSNVLVNNNIISTSEDYAITINDTSSNITITNNKLSSLKGRGNESIYGSTEIIENNTMANSVILLNNDNLEEFFTTEIGSGIDHTIYVIKENKIIENDTIIMNFDTSTLGRTFTFRFDTPIILKEINITNSEDIPFQTGNIEVLSNPLYVLDSNIYIKIPREFTIRGSSVEVINSTINVVNGLTLSGTPVTILNSTSYSDITVNGENTTIISSDFITPPGGLSTRLNINGQVINSSLPGVTIYSNNAIIINSTVFRLGRYNQAQSSNNIELYSLNRVPNNYILTYLYTTYKKIVDEDTGLLQDSIVEGDIVNVLEYDNETINIIIDRPVNLIGIQYEGVIKANVTFVEGSEGTNITNVTFNGTVNVNTTDINFVEGNIFNGPVNNPYVPAINIPVMININCSNVTVNNVDTPLSVNVTTIDGVLITEGYVEIYNDGILVEKTNLTEGNVNVTIKIENIVKNNPIRVWYYPEDDTYQQNNTIFNIESIKSNVTLTLENNTVRVNENETVSVLVNADNNVTVNDGNVTFIIRSWKFDVPVVDGVAKLNLIVNESWYERPTLRLIYSGADLFNYNSTTNIAMNILEAYPITLKVDRTEFTPGSNATIQASIYKGNDTYSVINKGKVIFKVNGKTLKDTNGKVIYAKIVNGTATIENYEVPSDWAKEGTTIQAVYSGSTDCDKLTSENTNLTVAKAVPTLTTSDITTTVNSTITLTATITDNDKTINTGKIVFKINGKTVKDASGKVIYAKVVNNTVNVDYVLPESMKAGNYTITATYVGSDYDKLEASETLTITT